MYQRLKIFKFKNCYLTRCKQSNNKREREREKHCEVLKKRENSDDN